MKPNQEAACARNWTIYILKGMVAQLKGLDYLDRYPVVRTSLISSVKDLLHIVKESHPNGPTC